MTSYVTRGVPDPLVANAATRVPHAWASGFHAQIETTGARLPSDTPECTGIGRTGGRKKKCWLPRWAPSRSSGAAGSPSRGAFVDRSAACVGERIPRADRDDRGKTPVGHTRMHRHRQDGRQEEEVLVAKVGAVADLRRSRRAVPGSG